MSHVSRWLGPPTSISIDAVDVARRIHAPGGLQHFEVFQAQTEQSE